MKVPVSSRRVLALLLALPLPAPLLAQEPVRTQPPPQVLQQPSLSGSVQVMTLRRGRLGIVVSLEQESSDSIGALVQSVTPNGPADKAGIRSGDVIVRVNGRALVGPARPGQVSPTPGMALITMGSRVQPGDTMVVQYQRGKERKNATIVAGDDPVWTFMQTIPDIREVPVPDGSMFEEGPEIRLRVDGQPRMAEPMRTPGYRMLMLTRPLADLELAPLNPELGRYFGTPDGVLVINVPPDSKLGLKPGDVVFTVDGRKVRSPGQLLRTLQSYEAGEAFKLEIMRLKKREVITGTITGTPPER